jgi:hypothetical protein
MPRRIFAHQARRVEAPPEQMILSEDAADRREAAEAREVAPPHRHRLADGERTLRQDRDRRDARRDHRAELQVLERGADRALARTGEQARHEPDLRVLERRDERPKIRPRDAHVRVGDDEHFAGRVPLEPDELRDLRVRRRVGIGHHDARVDLRVRLQEAPRDAERRVRHGRDAEQDLERGVIEARERLEVSLELVVIAGQRLEDGDARRTRGRRSCLRSRPSHRHRERAHLREVQNAGCRGREQREYGARLHDAHDRGGARSANGEQVNSS